MPHRRALLIALAALALLAACGDEGEAATTAVVTTAAPATTAAATTTTTAATTTTSDLHPAWEVGWTDMWPADGATATYRISLWGGGTADLPARVDYGVEWEGGTWDRITIGTVAPDEYGLALYFDRPEPWVIRVWGLQASGPGMGPTGVILEYPEEPELLELTGLPESEPVVDTEVLVDNGQDEPFGPSPARYNLAVVGLETVEVAAGTIDAALHLRLGLGGEFFGGAGPDEFTAYSDIWVKPGQLLVKWGEPAPGFGTFELLTLWE